MGPLPLAALRALLALGLTASTVACSNSWESDAIAARVVDARTGAPVTSAIVMVHWQLRGDYENYPIGQLAMFESLTDAQGAFHTPAWGPKRTRHRVRLDGDQPIVHVFKRGYEPLTVGNFVGAPGQDVMRAERHIRPHVNGQTLHLQPFAGSPREYSELLNRFWIPLSMLNGTSCDWPAAPQLFRALSEMKEEFLRADVSSDLQLDRNLCSRGVPQP